MKKILIANNNMNIGGVQKSLYNLLWTLHDKFEITLFLFSNTGEYTDKLPENVKVLPCDGMMRYLGIGQNQCDTWKDKLLRGTLAAFCRVMGRPVMMQLLTKGTLLPETYDCAISFLHNGRRNAFYGGTQEFILNCVQAKKKIAFLHCDYRNCGADHKENNAAMAEFDRIAACSEGCRQAFLSVLPELTSHCVTVRNFHRTEEIIRLANESPIQYEEGYHNVVMVSRLSHEKGIERAIESISSVVNQGIPVVLHIVGDGPSHSSLRVLAEEKQIAEKVRFYGEQGNPYRYMKNADLFLMTSYHEAAPMVIEEAATVGVPVLTTRTTSSEDMVIKRGCGWVCENTQQDLTQCLLRVLSDEKLLDVRKKWLRGIESNNDEAMKQFSELIEE